jgi:hypothetical protein
VSAWIDDEKITFDLVEERMLFAIVGCQRIAAMLPAGAKPPHPPKQPPVDHRASRWHARCTCITYHWLPLAVAMPRRFTD